MNTKSSYRTLHKLKGEFGTREAYLEHELTIMQPRKWQLNLPRRDFNFEIEDLTPAIAGTIGKVVMTTAIVTAFATGYSLSSEFIVENVRFEMLVAAVFFVILFSGFLNPRANLAGCHGPLIPLIPLIVVSGGHPLALGIMVGALGLLLGLTKGGSTLVNLTGDGVRGGLLIYLGMVGIIGQMGALRSWAEGVGDETIFFIIMLMTILTYAFLIRINKRWLAIPLSSFMALIVALIMGAPFQFSTMPGIPNLNPFYWWGAETGWMLGWPTLSHFIAVLPFAILAVSMWPPDFLGHRVFQEQNYPAGSEKVLMDVDDTMTVSSLRQIVGSVLGGGNLASSWGTYMIPAAIAKRPIPAGAILTGILCILVVLIGYPMDIAAWAPVLRVALIVGVFLPLLEVGAQLIKTTTQAQSGGLCIISSVLVNPVFGWSLALLLTNTGLVGDNVRSVDLPKSKRLFIPIATFIICTVAMAIVGLLPGISAIRALGG
ncbi:DUF3360 family protein [Candidatus Leptofilum sp.]|uniref:DUF3360 family protein n=1 Tax=Candidatus Leptofilum sp. TaxID=3241576 RepID=UPI003B5C347B